MTYNIRRAGEEKASANQWKFRHKFLISVIKKNKPDILCIQEDSPVQIEEIKKSLEGMDLFGFYNEEMNSGISGEANTIFFNMNKFKLLKKRIFWLTDTPDKKSKFEGQSTHYRTATCIMLKNETKEVSIFNTHFDHISEIIQEKEAVSLARLINGIKPKNYIICGDFNGDIDSRQIRILKESFNLITEDVANRITVIDWSEAHPPRKCLDFIFSNFLKRAIKIDGSKYLALDNKKRTPSDHLPVLCELEI